jgi:Glycosyltransferase
VRSLLFIGPGGVKTGFSRVGESLLRGLSREFEICQLAFNLTEPPAAALWPTYCNPYPDDIYGKKRALELAEELEPDIVLVYYANWYYPIIGPALEALREDLGFAIVLYLPIEGDLFHGYEARKLSGVDRIVTFTRFGKEVIEAAAAGLGMPFPEIEAIPHGVDRARFYPLAGIGEGFSREGSRREARARLFPGEPGMEDAFIALNANRNVSHKRIDLTIAGFALFARGKPENVWLYLHMKKRNDGIDVMDVAEAFGVRGRIILGGDGERAHEEPDEGLNLVYNACDVGINTSLGEGWGLVNVEHAATGAPQIVPRHSALTEVWGNAALFLEPRPEGIATTLSSGSVEVDPGQLAEKLELVYSDPSSAAAYGRKAYKRACLPEFDWGNIADRWSEQLDLSSRR